MFRWFNEICSDNFPSIMLVMISAMFFFIITKQGIYVKELEHYRDTNHACELDIDVEVGHQMLVYKYHMEEKRAQLDGMDK